MRLDHQMPIRQQKPAKECSTMDGGSAGDKGLGGMHAHLLLDAGNKQHMPSKLLPKNWHPLLSAHDRPDVTVLVTAVPKRALH